MNKKVEIEDLGNQDYKDTWDYQERLYRNLLNIKAENTRIPKEQRQITPNHLLFVEHPNVYTLGKSGTETNLLLNQIDLRNIDATFSRTNRGGDITYHGPGQIVGYPILDLENFNMGLKDYIYSLEEVIIRTLHEYGIRAGRLEGATGVWLDQDDKIRNRKICAIGVKSSRFATMHGFAFNINTNLDFFGYINPCGFTDKAVTSLEKELGAKQCIAEVKTKLIEKFSEVFGMKIMTKK